MRKIAFLLATVVVVLCGTLAIGQGQKELVVWCVAVHRDVAIGAYGAKIDVVSPFEKEHGVSIRWVTIPWTGMEEKVLRELALPQTEADIIFIVDDWARPDVLSKLMPLDDFMTAAPIEDFEGLAPGMVSALIYEGKLRGIPVRANVQVLHYNKAIFAKRGIEHAPRTFEELIEAAKAATYVREDGARVYGLGLKVPEDIIGVIRAFGGDVMTPDYQVVCDSPQAIAAIKALRDLYNAGALPPDFFMLQAADYERLVGQGLVAMVFFGDNYNLRFNDPTRVSPEVAGQMDVVPIPASETTGLELAPCKVAFWAMAIPNNAPRENRDLAWEFIRYLASPQVQLSMALNGNGPTRAAVLADPQYQVGVPYAWASALAINVARRLWPPFAQVSQAYDILAHEAVLAITGQKDPEQAMKDAAEALRALLR
jgi:multiple sugar transport system substrate-binding protein